MQQSYDQYRFRLVDRPAGGALAVAAALLLTAACAGDAPDSAAQPAGEAAADAAVRYGPSIELGEGTARVYVIMDGDSPAELGVAMSEGVVRGLPDHHSPGGVTMPDGMKTFEFELAMPAQNPTPFRHVTLDWNPGGHEPPGIYDVPHFDVHFYLIDSDRRRTILPTDPEFAAKAAHFPEHEFLPAGFVAPEPAAVPQMGVHWINPTSPEFAGEPFTRTFIYGTYEGELIFAEPMVTRDFLMSKPDYTAAIAVADRASVPGYYPSSYRVRWDEAAGEYRIALADFVRR